MKNKKLNKRYLEKRGLLIEILSIIVTIIIFIVMIKVPAPIMIVASTISISAIILITFASFYEFRDDYLYIRNGFLVNKVYYDKIKEIGDCKKIFKLNNKWIKDKVYINHGRTFMMGCTYIIPENLKEFKKELQKRIDVQKGEISYDKKIRKNSSNNQKHK